MTGLTINAPGKFVPLGAIAFSGADQTSTIVDATHPLPVTQSRGAAASAPLAGSTSVSLVAGPFTPELGRPIMLSLAGSWSGAVQLQRSIDGGTNKLPVTVGGATWGKFTANANEPIWDEGEAGATFYLAITLTAGTLSYRVAQ